MSLVLQQIELFQIVLVKQPVCTRKLVKYLEDEIPCVHHVIAIYSRIKHDHEHLD